ncbi:MAG: DUF4468 domain-containing protein [Bacteroidota bacterium]|nr:DUF4468 domain-containing protein [Bacteroidota bacterium]
MKSVFFFLLLPFFAPCQTVHIKGAEIDYMGMEKVAGITKAELYNRMKDALASTIKNYQFINEDSGDKEEIALKGAIKLRTPYPVIRSVLYSMKFSITDSGYTYHIDDVYLSEQQRGEKQVLIPSKELLIKMGESGKPAIETEQLLNEMDMNFQKLLAVLRKKILM